MISLDFLVSIVMSPFLFLSLLIWIILMSLLVILEIFSFISCILLVKLAFVLSVHTPKFFIFKILSVHVFYYFYFSFFSLNSFVSFNCFIFSSQLTLRDLIICANYFCFPDFLLKMYSFPAIDCLCVPSFL